MKHLGEIKPADLIGLAHATRGMHILSVLDYLYQGITLLDKDLNLIAWNKLFFNLLEFPSYLTHLHTFLKSLFKFNAERGKCEEGNIDYLVQQRIELAKNFKPHVIERIRTNATVIEVSGSPLPNYDNFVTIYTDINNLLTSILGNLGFLKQKLQSSTEVREAIQACTQTIICSPLNLVVVNILLLISLTRTLV